MALRGPKVEALFCRSHHTGNGRSTPDSGQSRSPKRTGRRRICRCLLVGCCDRQRNRRYAEKADYCTATNSQPPLTPDRDRCSPNSGPRLRGVASFHLRRPDCRHSEHIAHQHLQRPTNLHATRLRPLRNGLFSDYRLLSDCELHAMHNPNGRRE